MFETLFGTETPLVVRFLFAFFLMLGLIGAIAWAVVRRFGAGRLGAVSSHCGQPRLAVIDIASVDARRRLILVRRDNVEHFLMIGGPIDVVVEPNIGRIAATPHVMAVARSPAAADPRPSAIPSPDKRSWPQQQSAPAATPRLAPRIEPLPEETAAWSLESHTLATLADELSARRVPAPGGIPGSAPTRPTGQRIPIELAPANSTSADPTLAKLAHHLEAALRMPNTRVEPREACAPGTPASSALQTVEHAAAAVPQPQLHAVGVPDPRFRRAEANPSPEPLLYDSDSLAQGMANLLGRR